MARIRIAESHPDIGPLFACVVARLGHEPVLDESWPVDAIIVDVDSPAGRELARESYRSGTAFVCVSIRDPQPELNALAPAAYLVKPFALRELGDALRRIVGSPAPASA